MADTPEKKVKQQVKRWLTQRDAWYFMPVSNGMGVHGVPDIIACIYGRFVGIECKAPGKRGNTTPNQARQIRLINRAGGCAVVVDDVQQLDQLWHSYASTTESQSGGAPAEKPPESDSFNTTR